MLARLALVVLPLVLLAGCGGGDSEDAAGTTAPAATGGASTTAATGTDPTTTGPTTPESTVGFRLYYLAGEHLQAVLAESAAEPTAQEAVEALVRNAEGRPSAIPASTRVNGVTSGGGTAIADLSRAFGSGGGSLSMQARVAQVVYTLTQWPWIERVTIRLDGEDVEAIGGEGIPARGLERADFANVLAPIFVDVPPAGVETGSPLEASGSASVFEANVSLRLEAADGRVLAETFATAAEGAPGRGDFERAIAFDVDAPTDAILVAYSAAADDSGEERHAVRVPLRLCPAGGC